MYESYFGLAEAPFSIAPDPRYLYLSQRHQEALAHLLYGVNGSGGFVLLTGEVGAGKTTVCRCLLEQVSATCDVAYIFNPQLTVGELLWAICTEFGIDCPPETKSVKVIVDHINRFLLDAHAKGRHTVLIIDEAQNLSTVVLEQMRLLTNLETNQRKLLQIILLGQPELGAMLERPELRQLAQRVVARYHLGPLSKTEVTAYVRHRLDIAGTQRPLFPAAVLDQLYTLSKGIPRVINVLCDRALLGAYVQGKERVSRPILKQAAREVFYQDAKPRRRPSRALLASLVLVAGAAMALTLLPRKPWEAPPAPPPVAIKPPPPKAPPAKPAEILPATLEWPSDEPFASNRELANAALYKTWGLDYLGGDVCRQAEGLGLGLRCQSEQGGLNELRRYNRPAVLQMHDGQGREYRATLVGLDDTSATFAIGNATRKVALGALAGQWSGQYTLLWRLPPDTPKAIRKGDHGAAVEWLVKQLAQVQGKPIEAGIDPVFDNAMEQRVKQFQLAQGLAPDGAMNARTLARLSSEADQAAPRLIAPGREK